MSEKLYIHSKPYWEHWVSPDRPDPTRLVYRDLETDAPLVEIDGVSHELIVHDKMPIDQIEPSSPTEEVLASIRRIESVLAAHGLSQP